MPPPSDKQLAFLKTLRERELARLESEIDAAFHNGRKRDLAEMVADHTLVKALPKPTSVGDASEQIDALKERSIRRYARTRREEFQPALERMGKRVGKNPDAIFSAFERQAGSLSQTERADAKMRHQDFKERILEPVLKESDPRPRDPETGRFVEKAAWDQGIFYVTKDTDTGKATFSRERPQGVPLVEGKGSARKSYTVLSRDNDPPVDDTVNLGIVDAKAGEDLTFRARPVTQRQLDHSPFVAQKRQGGGFMVRDLRTGKVSFSKSKPRGARTVKSVFRPRSPFRRRRGGL